MSRIITKCHSAKTVILIVQSPPTPFPVGFGHLEAFPWIECSFRFDHNVGKMLIRGWQRPVSFRYYPDNLPKQRSHDITRCKWGRRFDMQTKEAYFTPPHTPDFHSGRCVDHAGVVFCRGTQGNKLGSQQKLNMSCS